MNQEELDRRVKDIAEEVDRRWKAIECSEPRPAMAARLALEGWEKPDPLLLEAREMCAGLCSCKSNVEGYRAGLFDGEFAMITAIHGLRRGYELGKEAAR